MPGSLEGGARVSWWPVHFGDEPGAAGAPHRPPRSPDALAGRGRHLESLPGRAASCVVSSVRVEDGLAGVGSVKVGIRVPLRSGEVLAQENIPGLLHNHSLCKRVFFFLGSQQHPDSPK